MLRNNKVFRFFMKDESGNILILVAFLMVVLLGASVLAVDTGSLYQARRQTVNAADAAALAGAQEIIRAHQAGITSDAGVRSAVTAKVTSYLGYHEADLVEVTDQDGNPIGADCKTVKVNAKKEAELFFVPAFYALLGSQSTGSDVSAIATARIEYNIKPVGSIAPFAIHESLFPHDGSEMVLFFQFSPGGKQAEPGDDDYDPWGSGNWGTVNFEGPGSNMNKIKDWIENGYEGDLSAEEGNESYIWAAPSVGLSNQPAQTEIQKHIDNQTKLIVPVITGETSGTGLVKIVGFAVIQLTYLSSPGANMYIKAIIIDPEYDISQLSSTDSKYDFGLHTATLIE